MPPTPPAPQVLRWTKVATYPHDKNAFTQGLVYWEPGILAESTGLYGQSTIRRVELKTGKVLSESKLDPKVFGEGLAKIGSQFIQITYREQKALQWTWSLKQGWKQGDSLSYEGEGWGLAADSKGALLMSNGSSRLFQVDPKTFKTLDTIQVVAGKDPQDRLNELEIIGNAVLANVWQSSLVLKINRKSGFVEGLIDLNDLVPASLMKLSYEKRHDAVPNGLAWDPKKKVLYVTGKLWPELYEIKVEGLE